MLLAFEGPPIAQWIANRSVTGLTRKRDEKKSCKECRFEDFISLVLLLPLVFLLLSFFGCLSVKFFNVKPGNPYFLSR